MEEQDSSAGIQRETQQRRRVNLRLRVGRRHRVERGNKPAGSVCPSLRPSKVRRREESDKQRTNEGSIDLGESSEPSGDDCDTQRDQRA